MTVHLIYRSYGGENLKSRPAWFSKLLCAASFARAAENADLRVTWLNDGPVPEDRMRLFEQFGEVMTIAGGPVGMRRSYVTGLRLAIESDWPDDDIVYFCEDDYLHTPDAVEALVAAEKQPAISYVALYGATPGLANEREYPDGYQYPQGWPERPRIEADGFTWTPVISTASTFGARLGALRADYPIFRQAMVPFRNRYLDHETCVLYQGQHPYHGKEFFFGPRGDFVPSARGVARAVFLVPFRVALSMRAGRNADDPHLLYAATPNLGCHVELGVMNPGQDWDALADDARTWAVERGFMPVAAA
ncbi:hypothetical protein [Mobilicoccus massiliensis]|uniref:hypothetical protein n=1 Tax=Mobilicoccus massiliensis TaxID=1522310 RepID=UPI0005907431|nr:hypothetical protein [Mobilicoccus massiliensis]